MTDLSNGATGPEVAYLGPPTSFSHQASLGIFPSHTPAILNAVASFADIFAAVQGHQDSPGQSKVTYGVVPFENSSNGSVVQLLDLIADHEGKYADVKVCAEYYLPVHHCLLVSGKSRRINGGGSASENAFGISKIYTHPQVWGQCSKFLAQHMKGVGRIDVSSTSLAAQKVKEEGLAPVAAIASKLAGEVNGLDVVAENIEDEGNNTTRFFVLFNQKGKKFERSTSTDGAKGERKWKALISFTIAHKSPGSLADALAVFKEFNFNLTSIDTRPSRKQPWHYVFFVECEEIRMAGDEENLRRMLEELNGHTEGSSYLGCWEDQQG